MSAEKVNPKQTARSFLLNVAAFIVIVAGMRAASSLLVPFLFALFIAVVCISPFFWLQRRGLPTIVSLFIILLVIIGIGFLFGALIGRSINQFSNNLPVYEKILEQKTTIFLSWLSKMGAEIPREQWRESFSLKEPFILMGGLVGALSNVLSKTVIIIMIVIFILLEAAGFPKKLQAVSNDPKTSLSNFSKIHNNIKRYMAIKTIISFATGLSVSIFLYILRIDYPLLWGMLAFLLNFIPNIGSLIAAIPAVLLALIQFGLAMAGITALGYLVINTLFGTFLEPKLMGQGLGLSTLVVFLSLIFWGWILGPVGMLLSIPLTMVVKIALDSQEETRWIGIMLGSQIGNSSEQ
jgi:AI-2 transport protein TqsA